MKAKEFNQLLKEKPLKKIIYLHCFSKITLTSYQLDKIIKLKKEAEAWKNKYTII